MRAVDGNSASSQRNDTAAETQSNKSKPTINKKQPIPINIQNELQPTKNYKIKADGRVYKIIVDKWVGDSLVAHSANKPQEVLKLHKNQIEAETIAEKRFSQPIADIITILVYAGIGVGIWMLVR
ncbi:hypothetical protein N0B16_03295 [Chryseobacterium sp. GMJ5]|uniref:Uncharacterized protein n=1 Tax=Chryseobacterium gilvum TaxID=2976534 RepID=A0ABT2VTY2_9FLAO|nr:hypothetical protein [Chryseobacterium gilvum]MCU7613453.1 hypothetical protein [Chryseobacterium gilvum]